MKLREFIPWILLSFMIGLGFGIWIYASQVEPIIYSRMESIESNHRLLVQGLTERGINVVIHPQKKIQEKEK